MLYIVGVTLLVAMSVALFRAARRDEYLVILHWQRFGYFVLERGKGGRYTGVRPPWVPLALVRYAARVAAAYVMNRVHARALARARSRAAVHKAHILGMKV